MLQRSVRSVHGARSGQIVVIFALMLTTLVGMTGIAIDVAHARSVAEDVQRAADAAAMAGVIFLPSNANNDAQTQAAALARANGFTDDGGRTTTITYTPNSLNLTLGVTITYKVPTSFLNLLGYRYLSVTRTATATYDDPLLMGAPDHMLGFAGFKTRAFEGVSPTGTYNQGFFLSVRGPYTGFEHGDAFSPYFYTTSNNATANNQSQDHLVVQGASPGSLAPQSGTLYQSTCSASGEPGVSTATCNTQANGSGTANTLVPNPYYNQENGGSTAQQKGYNFIFTVPPSSKAVLLKILDPLDECYFDGTLPSGANSWDGTNSANNVIGADGTQVGTESIDYCGSDGPPYTRTGVAPSWASSVANQAPTTLKLTLYYPSTRIGDDTAPQLDNTSAPSDLTIGKQTAAGPYNNPITAGPEWEGVKPNGSTTAHGAHRFEWLTLGKVTNTSGATEYVRLSIQSVVNSDALYAGTYGIGSNAFALGICSDDSTDIADMGDTKNDALWTAAGETSTTYDTGCKDPNTDVNYKYFNGGTQNCPAPGYGDQCYLVNGRTAMCIVTEGSNSGPISAYIPLAQIGSHLANSEVTVRLFDAGDVNLPTTANAPPINTNSISILGPEVNPSNSSTYPALFTESYHLDLAAPQGSAYSLAGDTRGTGISNYGGSTGTVNNWWASSARGCGADYNGSDHPNGDGSICPPLTTAGVSTPVAVAYGGNHNIANGTWLDFHMNLAEIYPNNTYLQGLSAGEDWWKVHYYLDCNASCSADDTTTWQVESSAAPVHLIGQ